MGKRKNRELGKQAAAQRAVEWIQEGMKVGLGTGSTAAYFIELLAERCKQGLKVVAAPTSQSSLVLAKKCGIPLMDSLTIKHLDLTVDGADEIDAKKRLIKGAGGALLWEKILASISDEMVVIADVGKRVERLGSVKLPIEIVSFAAEATLERIEALGCRASLRCTQEKPLFITDEGNLIVDADIRSSSFSLEELDKRLHSLPGVVETGLFLGLAGRVVLGRYDGTVEMIDA